MPDVQRARPDDGAFLMPIGVIVLGMGLLFCLLCIREEREEE